MICFLLLYIFKRREVTLLKYEISQKENQIQTLVQNINEREEGLRTQKEEIENEKTIIKQEKEKLLVDIESYNNAMSLFKQQKEAHEELNNKSEKDVAIDLYLKFLDLENKFSFFQTNMASIDAKLMGVKDYSDDLAKMKADILESNNILVKEMSNNKDDVNAEMIVVKDSVIRELNSKKNDVVADLNTNKNDVISCLNTNKDKVVSEITNSRELLLETYGKASREIQAIKNEMKSLQTMYSEELTNILLSLRAFLSDMQGTIQNIITENFEAESKKFFIEMYRFAGTIDQKINRFNETIVNIVDGKLGSVCNNIENKTINYVQTSTSAYISQYDNHISSFKNHVANIVEKIDAFNKAFDSRFSNLRRIIEESYNTESFSQTISDAVEHGIDDADISYTVRSGVDSAISGLNISSELENAFDSYRVKDKLKDIAIDGFNDCMRDDSFSDAVKDGVEKYFYYESIKDMVKSAMEDCLDYDFERKIRSAIDYEIGSQISQIESDVSDIKSSID